MMGVRIVWYLLARCEGGRIDRGQVFAVQNKTYRQADSVVARPDPDFSLLPQVDVGGTVGEVMR